MYFLTTGYCYTNNPFYLIKHSFCSKLGSSHKLLRLKGGGYEYKALYYARF